MGQIEILFQNKEFIAVNKPSGISVHNNEDPENLLSLIQSQLNMPQLFPVHRLDKETSGVQILALDSGAANHLGAEFQNHNVKKIYHGVLRGQLKVKQGTWNRPLTDKAEGRKNPEGISANRIPCETLFVVKAESKFFTQCEFDLKTGRQHQIRKHAAQANHPIVGDPRYGDPSYNKKMADLYKTERMFLHCFEINILKNKISSPVPEGFAKLFV